MATENMQVELVEEDAGTIALGIAGLLGIGLLGTIAAFGIKKGIEHFKQPKVANNAEMSETIGGGKPETAEEGNTVEDNDKK